MIPDLYHSLDKVTFRSTIMFQRRLLIIDQRFSMGFKSGELPGHSKVLMLLSFMNATTFLAVWQGARSC